MFTGGVFVNSSPKDEGFHPLTDIKKYFNK